MQSRKTRVASISSSVLLKRARYCVGESAFKVFGLLNNSALLRVDSIKPALWITGRPNAHDLLAQQAHAPFQAIDRKREHPVAH
ncbi:MAG: hypothetical protein JWQ23_1517 [Herminiimonas sp.]|nr:hypothetical protein [Herminiimonas sp.]